MSSSDDEGDGGLSEEEREEFGHLFRGFKQQGKQPKHDLPARARPLAFVSSSAAAAKRAPEPAAEAEPDEAAEEAEATRAQFKQLVNQAQGQAAFRAMLEQPAPDAPAPAQDAEGQQQKKPPPPRFDADFGKWQKRTDGFAAKMMAKMGFTGRLGKNESGIVNPIDVKVRPDRLGLSYGGFKEASTLKNNRAVEEDLKGEEPAPEQAPAPTTQVREPGQWRRKTKRVKTTKVFKTADELRTTTEDEGKVVDMRGPAGPPPLGEELLHNVSLLATRALTALTHTRHAMQAESAQAAALVEERAEAQRRLDAARERRERLQQLRTRLAAAAAGGSGGDPESFGGLLRDFAREARALRLARLVPQLALPGMQARLASWAPLRDGAAPAARLLAPWAAVLLRRPPGDVAADVEDVAAMLRGEGDDAREALAELVHAAVLPPVRLALQAEWDSAAAAALLLELRLHIPDGALRALLSEAVRPQLERAVRTWDPLGDDESLDVLRWRPLMPDAVDALLPAVRVRLAGALQRWQAGDPAAERALRPLAGALPEAALATLLVRAVVPKLVLALEAAPVDGAAPPPALAWALRWADLVPREHTVAAVVGALLGRWRRHVRRLLRAGRGKAAAAAYAGWKAALPPALLREPRVRGELEGVMGDMARQLAGLSVRAAPRATYQTVLRGLVVVGFGPARAAAAAPAVVSGAGNAPRVSFRDVVADFAAERGVEFGPHPRRSPVDGNTVYVLGSHAVYLSQDVVYVARGGGKWEAVALENLA